VDNDPCLERVARRADVDLSSVWTGWRGRTVGESKQGGENDDLGDY